MASPFCPTKLEISREFNFADEGDLDYYFRTKKAKELEINEGKINKQNAFINP